MEKINLGFTKDIKLTNVKVTSQGTGLSIIIPQEHVRANNIKLGDIIKEVKLVLDTIEIDNNMLKEYAKLIKSNPDLANADKYAVMKTIKAIRG
jgi:hypothetical protein